NPVQAYLILPDLRNEVSSNAASLKERILRIFLLISVQGPRATTERGVDVGCRGHPWPWRRQRSIKPLAGAARDNGARRYRWVQGSPPAPGGDGGARALAAVAQIVSGHGRIDQSGGRSRVGIFLVVELLLGAGVEHQHAARMQGTAGNLENPNRISDCARGDQVEAVANVERLGAPAYDPNVAQPHLDYGLAQKRRPLAARLDQRHLGVNRGGNHQSREDGAAADIQKAPVAIEPSAEPQDLRADRNRDRDDTVEDVEHDLAGVLGMRRQIDLRAPQRERRGQPLDSVQELGVLGDYADRRDCGRELSAHLRGNLVWISCFLSSFFYRTFHVKHSHLRKFTTISLDYFPKRFT